MIGKLEDLSKLSIFNTNYRIKVKGYIETTYPNVSIYIIETHGKLYALEINNDYRNPEYILHDDFKNHNNFNSILKISQNVYKLNKELIIDNNDFSKHFKSNIFDVETTKKIFFDRRILASRNIKVTEATLNEDIKDEIKNSEYVSRKEFKEYLFGKESIINDISLDEIIHMHSTPKENSKEKPSMGCRTPLPTIKDLMNNLNKKEINYPKTSSEAFDIAKIIAEKHKKRWDDPR